MHRFKVGDRVRYIGDVFNEYMDPPREGTVVALNSDYEAGHVSGVAGTPIYVLFDGERPKDTIKGGGSNSCKVSSLELVSHAATFTPPGEELTVMEIALVVDALRRVLVETGNDPELNALREGLLAKLDLNKVVTISDR